MGLKANIYSTIPLAGGTALVQVSLNTTSDCMLQRQSLAQESLIRAKPCCSIKEAKLYRKFIGYHAMTVDPLILFEVMTCSRISS